MTTLLRLVPGQNNAKVQFRVKRPKRSVWERIRLKRRAARIERHRLRRKPRSRRFQRAHRPGNELPAPTVFGLGANRKALIRFLAQLRHRIVKLRKPTLLDFAATAKFHADATLLFYAELRRCIELTSGGIAVTCRPPRNLRCNQVLHQIGVYELLGHRSNAVPFLEDVIHWKVASGHRVEGEKYENVLGRFDGRVADALLGRLYVGLSEAMTNCHHHAYIVEREDGLDERDHRKNWWMFSQERDGFLTVVFCDLGAGIPRTLPITRPTLFRQIIGMGGVPRDCDAIDKAIESSISRTGKRHRGKGLKQLLEAVKTNDSNFVRVLSNSGCYTFRNGNKELTEYGSSIQGTLIAWHIQLEADST